MKRAADLGINRGLINSNMAKHLIGLAAANYGASPGKKRRSEKMNEKKMEIAK